MSNFKPGDEAIVTKAYPIDTEDALYKVGDIIQLISSGYAISEYWYTTRHKGVGIFEANFRKATKLDKALK